MRISFNGESVEEYTYFDCIKGIRDGGEKTTDIFLFGNRADEETGDYFGEFKVSEFGIERCMEVSKKITKQLLEKGWLDLSKIREIEIY